jgi:cyclopropane-fatty-acyl-phospholipid synthase
MYLKLLDRHIKQGILHLHMPDGQTHTFGTHGLEVNWYIRDEKAIRRIARDWEFELGQTYMEGGWDTGDDELRNLIGILRINFAVKGARKWNTPLLKLLQQYNTITRSYRYISHHYDTDEAIFRMFLDREMYYSCAYFTYFTRPGGVASSGGVASPGGFNTPGSFYTPGDSLEQAQQNKADIIARKLLLKPGMKVLDIGCGWGSLAFHLARHHDVHVTGITLSQEQLRVARQEARARGLEKHAEFLLADYREHQAKYDRVVSVGMLEHVGVENFSKYFSQVNAMLADDGVALVHTIANKAGPQQSNPWITRYIFPGGRIPSISETTFGIESGNLILTDMEVWRMHYAWTLREWLKRFRAHREEIVATRDEMFYRMWEFYLAVCDMSFEFANLVVLQCQLAKQHGSVPVTRDYLYK